MAVLNAIIIKNVTSFKQLIVIQSEQRKGWSVVIEKYVIAMEAVYRD